MTSVVRMGRQMPSVATDLITLCDAVALSHGGALRWPLGSPAVSEAWIHRGTLVAVGRVGSQWRNRRSEPLLKGTYVRGKQFFKIGGFIGTLTAGAALVATATAGTGAYFTDSAPGNIRATTGHLTLNTSSTDLVFGDLVPGEYKTLNINYNVDASSNSDVWLTFDPTSVAYQAFTGAKNNPLWPDGGMGRFGHFKVSNNGTQRFTSFNLQNGPDGCSVDANGNGGSAQQASSVPDTPPYCGVPTAIKLADNLSSGQGGTISVEFGVSGRWTAQRVTIPAVPFKVVATQHGVRPDAANF